MEEGRKKVGFNTKEEEEIKVDKKSPTKKGNIEFFKIMFTITVSFIILFPVFKALLEESGFLEDVKPKPKPIIGIPRGRSFSPKKSNAVKCNVLLKP